MDTEIIEILRNKIAELEAWNNRLLIVASNAIDLGQLQDLYPGTLLCKELGCTTEELKKIMEV